MLDKTLFDEESSDEEYDPANDPSNLTQGSEVSWNHVVY